ncbi:hypothetical protein FAIPA1_110030 [Frankia sp. AiPs1]
MSRESRGSVERGAMPVATAAVGCEGPAAVGDPTAGAAPDEAGRAEAGRGGVATRSAAPARGLPSARGGTALATPLRGDPAAEPARFGPVADPARADPACDEADSASAHGVASAAGVAWDGVLDSRLPDVDVTPSAGRPLCRIPILIGSSCLSDLRPTADRHARDQHARAGAWSLPGTVAPGHRRGGHLISLRLAGTVRYRR